MTAVKELQLYFAKSNNLLGEKGWKLILKIIELEKQQIKDAYNQGYREGLEDIGSCWLTDKDVSEHSNAENYYNEIFNK